MPSPNRLTSLAASTPFESKRLYSPLSGSESDRSSDLDSIGSYRGSPSPEPAKPEHHQASIRSKLIAYLDYPVPLSGFFYHPVTSEQFWSLRDTSEFREVLEGRGHTYNPKTRTLEVNHMSVGLHNAGWMWLSTGFDAMCEEGIIDPKDLAQKARRVRNPVGLIAQAENKAYYGFDERTQWKDMCRTPDWCLYRISSNLAGDKPFIVMEIGVSQRMKRLPGSKSKRESLQDRAEGWLLATGGITKAVVLINLSRLKNPSTGPGASSSVVGENDVDADTDAPTDHEDLFQSAITVIKVTVQIWRLDPTSGRPSISENHAFTVSGDSNYWEDGDVPPDFPVGITFLPSDFYETPAADKTFFVLPMIWLREYIIGFWSLHVEAAMNAKEAKKRRVA